MTTTSSAPATTATAPLRALQVTAALALLVLGWQFVSAGELVASGLRDGLDGHAAGAVVLHVVSGLAAAAAVWLRLRGGSTALAALAVGVFLVGFLQAWSGDHAPLTVHVPLAIITVATAVWLVVASFTAGRRRAVR
ncbi:hypothetical protein [Pseudokineococcus lusitanus]|jgi:hypothetical protein|uniref:hypothetical protein n=1 Tax=Pseudokineococcus lusitanus TaxID=763993 RepID=UPI000F49654A|nr:hypothetical protein [Pseudokineococcus lusitanus]